MPGRSVYFRLQNDDVNLKIMMTISVDDVIVARAKVDCDDLREYLTSRSP